MGRPIQNETISSSFMTRKIVFPVILAFLFHHVNAYSQFQRRNILELSEEQSAESEFMNGIEEVPQTHEENVIEELHEEEVPQFHEENGIEELHEEVPQFHEENGIEELHEEEVPQTHEENGIEELHEEVPQFHEENGIEELHEEEVPQTHEENGIEELHEEEVPQTHEENGIEELHEEEVPQTHEENGIEELHEEVPQFHEENGIEELHEEEVPQTHEENGIEELHEEEVPQFHEENGIEELHEEEEEVPQTHEESSQEQEGNGLEPLHQVFGETILVSSEAVRKAREEEENKHVDQIINLNGQVNYLTENCKIEIEKLNNEIEILKNDNKNLNVKYEFDIKELKIKYEKEIEEIKINLNNRNENNILMLRKDISNLNDQINAMTSGIDTYKMNYEHDIRVKEEELNKNEEEINKLDIELNHYKILNNKCQSLNKNNEEEILKLKNENEENLIDHDKTQVLLNDWKTKYMNLEIELDHMTERARNPDLVEAISRKGSSNLKQLFESNPGLEVAMNKTLDYLIPSYIKQKHGAELILNLTAHLAPYTGPSYTPFVSGILVYGLLFIPLILTIYCLTSIRAVLKIRPVLIFMHLYCCLGCLIAAMMTIYLEEDALQVFYHSGNNTFLFFQIFMLIFYIIHLIMIFFITIFKYVNLKELLIRIIQLSITISIGLVYYDMVWEHSLLNEPPEILYSNKIELPYIISCLLYFLIFSLETIQRKALLQEMKKINHGQTINSSNQTSMKNDQDMFRITMDSRLDEAELNAEKAE